MNTAHLPVQPRCLADAAIPINDTTYRLVRDVALVVGFTLFTALMARVAIPLGFTPVPITGQTLAVLLTGAALGSRRGAAAMTLYLIAGAWLPFYAGGSSGLVWNMASGGYIIGFIPAAFIVGYLAERGWDRQAWIVAAMAAGNIVIYVPGLVQLSLFVPESNVLGLGLYPFIPGDLVKIGVASIALPSAWAALRWTQGRIGLWK